MLDGKSKRGPRAAPRRSAKTSRAAKLPALRVGQSGAVGKVGEQVRRFRAASKADETKRALDKQWRAFEAWCRLSGAVPVPCSPEVMEAYLVHLAEGGRKTASIEQARWAINAHHRLAGLAAPGELERVKVLMAGIKRSLGMKQQQKAALTIDHLRRVPFGDGLTGKRDKALLLIGFAAGLRRSELAGLQVEELAFSESGVRLHIRRSKTDQVGRGEVVEVVHATDAACCPVVALRAWLTTAGIEAGPVFRSINKAGRLGPAIPTVTIGQLVKGAAHACGLDPAQFGAHSLRAGCATFLLDRGVPLNIVAKQGRWKKAETVLRYDRNTTAKALAGIY